MSPPGKNLLDIYLIFARIVLSDVRSLIQVSHLRSIYASYSDIGHVPPWGAPHLVWKIWTLYFRWCFINDIYVLYLLVVIISFNLVAIVKLFSNCTSNLTGWHEIRRVDDGEKESSAWTGYLLRICLFLPIPSGREPFSAGMHEQGLLEQGALRIDFSLPITIFIVSLH